MKVLAAITFLVVAVSGQQAIGPTKVELYTRVDCSGLIPLEKSTLNDTIECVAIGGPMIPVAELGATYSYLRLSSQFLNEVLLFSDYTKCVDFPQEYDPTQQVTFIRSTIPNTCTPCYRCGNVKAVMFSPVEIKKNQSKLPGSIAGATQNYTHLNLIIAVLAATTSIFFV